MAEELLPSDVETFTKGRILSTDPDVERALNSALSRVRRYCGWHVSPVRTETRTFDSQAGHHLLFLPSLKVVSIDNVIVDGLTLDLVDVKIPSDIPGAVYRQRGWPCGWGNVEITYTHGYTAEDAEDWREVVLSLIDQATITMGQGRSGPVISKRVDDVYLNWSGLPNEVENAPMDKRTLAPYRLLAL